MEEEVNSIKELMAMDHHRDDFYFKIEYDRGHYYQFLHFFQ